ncbi:MAG: hypothetical protein ACI8UZ_003543, partial [Akkermansiaceae bacterium]
GFFKRAENSLVRSGKTGRGNRTDPSEKWQAKFGRCGI